ncbi:class I SAM-dependent methyltransferase [Thaumasiovibrio subtropicus]|uniref:class I SAM-dependent methyltransferase n=1 Tax=Thaumasiovibrio subtropicus TaxID=1891207 RepID=UPI000B34D21D|nr:class I SAM-dependent methyltransferase [Thaumasiovibrio subtropicus]
MTPEAIPVLKQHLVEQLSRPLTEAERLFHGRGRCWSGLEQITVDWLSGQCLVSLFKMPTEVFTEALITMLNQLVETPQWQAQNASGLLLQYRDQPGSPTDVIWGELASSHLIKESGLTYQLDLGRNQNNGLFLDMRNGRDWVKARSAGKRVLNLFAYTCGFSVAAIEGGADLVVNIDMAKASLSRGRDNHRHNNHDLSKVKFLGHDILKSFGKIKKSGPYDLIVIDPPTFQKGSFALTKDYQKILRRLPDLLVTGGEVLACVNDPHLSADFLIEEMAREVPSMVFQHRLDNPDAFKDIDEQGGLKALVFQ